VNPLSRIYGAAASWRRQWYGRNPSKVRRLGRPVVSVGNLRAGGSGKTPVVAHLARVLLEQGERPAILTRGYGRPNADAGVTMVSDGRKVLADYASAGDEPLMLARALSGVPVLVGADRYLSGSFAERRLDATVHILDDGFQHLELGRTADLLLVDESDLTEPLLPAGRLREPIEAAKAADALLVTAATAQDVARIASRFGVETAFRVQRAIGPGPVLHGVPRRADVGDTLAAFAGIARPERFFDDLGAAGWRVAKTIVFRDHHRYTQNDIARIVAEAKTAGATALATTEKDAIRLESLDVSAMPIAVVSVSAVVEPQAGFVPWLMQKLADARA
jgi:tetraacyldisaccharide 4'-kinase